MKSFVLGIAVIFSLSLSSAVAQDLTFPPGKQPSRPAPATVKAPATNEVERPMPVSVGPTELHVIENEWRESGGPYTGLMLAIWMSRVAEKVDVPIASNTIDLINESNIRDILRSIPDIAESDRLKTGTLVLGKYAWEMTTGNVGASSDTMEVRIGNLTVRAEKGKVKAFVAIRVKDLISGQYVKSFVGYGERSSTNLEGLDYGSWFQRSGFPIEYWTSNNSPTYRRAMIATVRALDDLERQIIEYYR